MKQENKVPGCCEKCHGYYVEPKHEYFPLCNNVACDCHKVLVKKVPEFELRLCQVCNQMTNHIGDVCQKHKVPEWEEEFDNKFVEYIKNVNGGIAYVELRYGEQTDVDELKSFIKSTLEKEREKLENEIRKVLLRYHEDDVYYESDLNRDIINLIKGEDLLNNK